LRRYRSLHPATGWDCRWGLEILDCHFSGYNSGHMMKKSILLVAVGVCIPLLLVGCAGSAEDALLARLDNRPPAPGMPYEDPQALVGFVPGDLPFPFSAPPGGEVLGTVEDGGGLSGTVLLTSGQSAADVRDYYSGLLGGSSFADASELWGYYVFFPPQGEGATFCNGQAGAVVLEITPLEDGTNDVRLHYTTDAEVIGRMTCGQPVLAIEDFPFPYLPAPPAASGDGGSRGGGGGGGGGTDASAGPLGFTAEIEITSDESLAWVNDYYRDLLVGEGWIVIDESSTGDSFETSWDFGYYQTRSWLARLIVSSGDAPDQYRVEFRAVSP
jgi:hypothetical protein